MRVNGHPRKRSDAMTLWFIDSSENALLLAAARCKRLSASEFAMLFQGATFVTHLIRQTAPLLLVLSLTAMAAPASAAMLNSRASPLSDALDVHTYAATLPAK